MMGKRARGGAVGGQCVYCHRFFRGRKAIETHMEQCPKIVHRTVVMPEVELPEGFVPPSAAVITPPALIDGDATP